MAAIGSLTIHAWRGSIQGEMRPVEVIRRAGVDGTGLLVGNYHSTPSVVETDYYGTKAQVESWTATANTLVGTSVSITDGLGSTWTDAALLDLSYVYIRAKIGGVLDSYIVRATWTIAVEV
jgi:hypothetical protein